MVLRVGNLLGKFLRRSGHGWSFAWVVLRLSNRNTVLNKVELDLITSLTLIETDSDLASAETGALHIVFVNGC